jgi:hypothetical protein
MLRSLRRTAILLVPMRRMGTHSGCAPKEIPLGGVASSSKLVGWLVPQGSIDATHLALRSHAAHGNEMNAAHGNQMNSLV